MEGAGGESKFLNLIDACLHDFGVAMALVQGAEPRHKVEILGSIGVIHVAALASIDDDRRGSIVRADVLAVQIHEVLGRV